MKTSLIVAAIVVLHKISTTKGKEKFACPVECPPNVYRPICSRGKSYANLCILKQQICKGKTAWEIYDDIEKCPGYEKEDDASGKSVEAIDKNGVLFRHHLNDPPKRKTSGRNKVSKHSISDVQTSKKSHRKSLTHKDHKSDRACPRSCSDLVQPLWPLFFNLAIDFPRRCPLQFLFCRSFIPAVSVNFVANCQKSKEESNSSTSDEDEVPLGTQTGLLDASLLENSLKRSKTRRTREANAARAETTTGQKFCHMKCDFNDRRPVCWKNYKYRNRCYLKMSFCNGWIDKEVFTSATDCRFTNGSLGTQSENSLKRSKTRRSRKSNETRVETTTDDYVCNPRIYTKPMPCDGDKRTLCWKNTLHLGECALRLSFCDGLIDMEGFMGAIDCRLTPNYAGYPL